MHQLNAHPLSALRISASVPSLLAIFSAGCIFLPAANGFESREHRDMSDLAVSVVLEMAKTKDDQGRPLINASQQSIDELRLYAGKYGRITECVDFFMFPEKMLAYGWKMPPSTMQKERPPVSPDSLPSAKYQVWDELLNRCGDESLAVIQASHNNHAHFQQDLLMSLRVWHLNAVAVASTEKNVYGGLFLNSMADHYLHDFFAPGHQVTSRDRLTDMPATATHDLGNEMGALFQPNLSRETMPGALKVLEFMCHIKRGEFDSVGARCDPLPGMDQILNPPKDDGQTKKYERSIRIKKEDFIAEVDALRKKSPVLLRGDGQLSGEAQARQRTLMLAVQAASILDVLEGSNSFTRFDFSFDMKEGLPHARTDFGQYYFDVGGQKIDEAIKNWRYPGNSSPSVEGSTLNYHPIQFTRCSLGGCQDELYKMRTRFPILSIGLQRESHANGADYQRSMATIEGSSVGMVFNASKVSGNWLDGVEFVPSLGYGYYSENGFRGNGPIVRLSASVPETEFSLSTYVRWLNYPTSGENVRRMSFGVRADAGFSSYFTFFISGGLDHAVTRSGSLAKGLVLGAGIRVGAPLSRLNPSGLAGGEK